MTITTRNTPIPRRVSGGPTLLTLGKTEPRELCKELVTAGKVNRVCIEMRIAAPIIGPSIVLSPPITLMISGKNELAGAKMELSINLVKNAYNPPAMPAKNVLITNAKSLYFAVLIPIILASASFPCISRQTANKINSLTRFLGPT